MTQVTFNDPQLFQAKPTCILVVGMAGSGKTSFIKALREYIHEHDSPAYSINTDPAVHYLPYEPNIDIRDTIDYKEVMKEYHLGPNGAILTSLNLFSTKMNEIVELINKNSHLTNHVIIDTPGQIEVFKWSASGKIIIESLLTSFPTVIVYVIDCSKCTNPLTFMSNMLYASGLAVEYQLPFLMVMNKTDIIDCKYLTDWMTDVTQFFDDIETLDLGFMSTTVHQIAQALEKFYGELKRTGVSSLTGHGLVDVFEMLKNARQEFFDVYLKEVLPQYLSSKEEENESIFINLLDNADNEDENDEGDDNEEDD